MTSEVYPGEPLQPDQIRLIELRPGSWTDPIVCDLHNVRYEDACYFALSYVWGSRGKPCRILLAGQTFDTTTNLERALRYIRQRNPEGVNLWADALCIDQGSMKERTHQVELMGQIYSKCEGVIVYLGDRLEYESSAAGQCMNIDFDRNTQPVWDTTHLAGQYKRGRKYDAYQAFCLIQELGTSHHLGNLSVFHRDKNASRVEALESSRILESLRRLMHNPFTPWWSRVWVIQEAALGPQIEVLHGTLSAHWIMFIEAAINYTLHSTTCCSRLTASLPRDQTKVLDDFSKRVLIVNNLRRVRDRKPLLDLLRQFRDRQATDVRDKVYALLSLADSSVRPDYSLSEVEVFQQATEDCIRSSRSLTVLNTALGRKARADLPSWVPDWSAFSSDIHDVRAEIAELYDAWPNKDAFPPAQAGVLQVKGLRCGRVVLTHEVMWGDVQSIVHGTLERWWKILHEYADMTQAHSKASNAFGAFWCLICAEVVSDSHSNTAYRRTDPRDELTFAAWALWSPRSPFHGTKEGDILEGLLSDNARAWLDVILLWPDRSAFMEASQEGLCSPSGLEEHPMYRSGRIASLLHYAGAPYSLGQMVDGSGAVRHDGPWNHLLIKIRSRLLENYPGGVDLDLAPKVAQISTFDSSIVRATLFRKLIIFQAAQHESSWFCGLGPAEVATGDELFLLQGARTPFVLRSSIPPGSSLDDGPLPAGQSMTFSIVGDCYVHDLMDFKYSRRAATQDWTAIGLV